MISNEDVNSAYLLLLNRQPENDEAIAHWLRSCDNTDQLVRGIIGSDEFKSRQAVAAPAAVRSIKETPAQTRSDQGGQRFYVTPDPQLVDWLNNLDQIEGWLVPGSGFVSAALAQIQVRAGYGGHIAEIGVYHGKYLIGLATTLQVGEKAIAIDVFDDQAQNADLVGYDEVGSTGIHSLTERDFVENAKRFCPNATLAIIKRSSLDVQPAHILSHGNRVRFFSIDGGHTTDVLLNDLRLAEATLAPHGIISIDDILNPQWPGIVTGAVRFFDGNTNLRPVAFIANKLLCAFEPYADMYRRAVLDVIPRSIQRRDVEFSKYTADQYHDGDDIYLFLEGTKR